MTTEDFCLRLTRACRLAPGAHVLAAVSGGADSTALLCFLCEARERLSLKVSCAHVEHGIRGGESLRDMAFVAALCERLRVPLYTARVDAPGYAKENGCGLEDAARTLRYAFLEDTARQTGADAIALAHHARDQAETVLLHAGRGSDLRGLCAMRYRSGLLIRPLLEASPDELRAYLLKIGQPWREDATNESPEPARNRVRMRVMPELERACPGAGEALCRLARAAQRDEDFFVQQLDALDLRVTALVDGAAMERAQLEPLHEALRSRAIVRLAQSAGVGAQSARTIGAISRALERETAAINLTDGAQARLGARYLCLTRAKAQIEPVPLSADGLTQTPFGTFAVRDANAGETGDGKASQVIPERLLRGCAVTARREGDSMVPFGRHTPVPLKKLMIEAGVERAMRKSVPILRGEAGILWAVGLRPGEACRAREGERTKLVTFLGRQMHAEGLRAGFPLKKGDGALT